MLTYPPFHFASAPRTGTSWFQGAAAIVGLGETQKAKVHIPPPPDWDGFLVTIVRHPYDWLESIFFSLRGGLVPDVESVNRILLIAREHQESGFPSFIWTMYNEHPGAVEKMFDSYRASSVLRLEDFPWAAIEFFRQTCKPLNLDSAARLPPQNNRPFSISGDISLRDRAEFRRLIQRSEENFCGRYDYHC